MVANLAHIGRMAGPHDAAYPPGYFTGLCSFSAVPVLHCLMIFS